MGYLLPFGTLVVEGHFCNVLDEGVFDLDRPYWYKDRMEDLRLVDGYQYLLAGDYFINVLRQVHISLLNKDLYMAFSRDGSLMVGFQFLGSLENDVFRQMESDVAVLPYPMLNASDKKYTSSFQDPVRMGAIPTTSTDMEFISTVIEVLNRGSASILIPQYYHEGLKVRFVDDEKAAAMIDIIHAAWENASIRTGDFDLHYTREGMTVTLTRPAHLTLRMRLYAEKLTAVEGARDWKLVPVIGGMVLEADMGYTHHAELKLTIEGFRDLDRPEELTRLPSDMTDIYDPQNAVATPYGHHMMFRKTPEGWYREIRLDLGEDPIEAELVRKQREPVPEGAGSETVDLSSSMNADVRQIFKQRYVSPRPERGCHAQIGYDGYSLWTFPFWGIYPHDMEIDRHGILESSSGVPLLIAEGDRNVVFTSLWDNYPDRVEIPVGKEGRMAFVAVSGSTSPDLCGIENARLTFRYTDGTEEILPLVDPRNYIQLTPYPERALTKGYEERRDVFNKYDEDLLKDFTPEVLWLGEKLRTLVIRWPMKANAVLGSVTIETTSPDVVAGVMAITIAR